MTAYRKELDRESVRSQHQRLATRGPLRAVGEGRPRYEFRVDPVWLWTEQHMPLAQAVQVLRAIGLGAGTAA